MLHCIQNKDIDESNQILFKGQSCYPLSPDAKKGNDNCISSKDQINKIFKALGSPDDLDTSFITDPVAKQYIANQCDNKVKSNKLHKMFPSVNPELIKLLKGLLEFNPHFRMTAAEALQSPVFDDIRISAFEQPSSKQI